MSTIAAILVTLAIIPTQARDETRGIIKVRGGPEKPGEVRAGRVDPTAFAGRTRIAVLPFAVPDGDASLAWQRTGGMEDALADLRFVPAYLVSDRSEILTVVGRNHPTQETLPELATKLGVTEVIVGKVLVVGTNQGVELKLYRIEGGLARLLATSKAVGPKDQGDEIGTDVLLGLLEQVKTTPPDDRVAEMKKVPTTRVAARVETEMGFSLLDNLAGKARSSEAVARASEAALTHAKAAQKADKKYLRAYMLEASCLFNLGATPKLKECLEVARSRVNPEKVDALTRLEFEGDYLAYRDGKFADAAKEYEKMLAFDPGNLHALWSLTGLYSGDDASRYAARLVLAHPKSAAAEVFTPKPSQP